ncbi:hypothetical protein H4R19_002360, partial [Coemansia spiralis]
MSIIQGWLVKNTTVFPNPQRVCELVEAALTQFPSLRATTVPDTSSDSAMRIDGTLPVVFHGSTFNIPVEFTLPPMFPDHSPKAYVRPTSTMVVKVGKHVDASGRVFHPYLASWSWGSTLGELFRRLIAAFSVEPPVFSRPAAHPATAIAPAQALPGPGQASRPPPPQMLAAASLSTPEVRQHHLAPGVSPMEPRLSEAGASVEAPSPVQPASTPPPLHSAAAVVSVEQGLARLTVAPGAEASAGPSPKQPQIPAYTPHAVPGRPPVPALGVAHAPRPLSPEAVEHSSHTEKSGGAQPWATEDDPPRAGADAEAQLAAGDETSAKDSRRLSQAAPPQLRTADSTATVETSAEAAPGAAAATITPTTAVDDVPAAAHSDDGPKSPVASSLLDEEPMDDPQKRHLGYQLAIYDRVMDAVNRSREKHTRVNKELLDQSANLNSGAGVIAEERQQLLESQRQLSANIGVLEHKLNELNEKKAEFPDAAAIADVRRVFCGQTPAMDQLFDLAGEIA